MVNVECSFERCFLTFIEFLRLVHEQFVPDLGGRDQGGGGGGAGGWRSLQPTQNWPEEAKLEILEFD